VHEVSDAKAHRIEWNTSLCCLSEFTGINTNDIKENKYTVLDVRFQVLTVASIKMIAFGNMEQPKLTDVSEVLTKMSRPDDGSGKQL
jgi:hypothetical protein